ncbi:MAG: hypothetical protein ACI9BW_000666 [Gammaproteobacteria bacterium]|jgi:uncharacterized protein (DUF1800 family)
MIRRFSLFCFVALFGSYGLLVSAVETSSRRGDLTPLAADEWNRALATHLLERTGFGATPEEIELLSKLSPQQAVRRLVRFEGIANVPQKLFEHSGIFKTGLDPFPSSRPATSKLAAQQGAALGIKVKESGNRPMQSVINEFFYWLRASRLETDRVVYWWANRMIASPRALEEKMALFWHGHFATNEDKVRDYRKMLRQLNLFQSAGLGDFRSLMIGVAQDPAMLTFLDAGVNVKGAPNENFAREIMELFTMGVGNYTERDIREAARAFTGWNYEGLQFKVNVDLHDAEEKEFLGRKGNFDGVEIIDIILDQPATPEYLASKLYRFFVREDIEPEFQGKLGAVLKESNYNVAAFLETVFLSRDFYAQASVATRIKSPVELLVSTYRKLGLKQIPGAPDFNLQTEALGQRLMHPPTVAGWAQGRSWITPGLLLERGNFALDVMFADLSFIPLDRYPKYAGGAETLAVDARIRAGLDITSATKPSQTDGGDMMAMSNAMADRDEAFNTRFASYRGWQMAIEKVKPIDRSIAALDLTKMVMDANLATPDAVVNYFADRFLAVPLDEVTHAKMAEFLQNELGTENVRAAETYLEDPLRALLHIILSRPEYQLG